MLFSAHKAKGDQTMITNYKPNARGTKWDVIQYSRKGQIGIIRRTAKGLIFASNGKRLTPHGLAGVLLFMDTMK
jgi:hypothetical protein